MRVPSGILVRCFAFACLIAQGAAWSADPEPVPRFKLKGDAATGSNIRRDVVTGSRVPFEKRYEQLTPDEQASVKAFYEKMGPDDEPPYPARGLKPIYDAIAGGQQQLHVQGDMTLAVDIDSKGEAQSVTVLKSTDDRMARFAASVLMTQRYKPAVCDGQPCAMQFPFRITFTMTH